MTTSRDDTPHGVRRNRDLLGAGTVQSAVVDAVEREARLRRLILVGALASFLGLFGLTVAFDHQSRQAEQAKGPTVGLGTSPLPFSSDADDDERVSDVPVPQMRTGSS